MRHQLQVIYLIGCVLLLVVFYGLHTSFVGQKARLSRGVFTRALHEAQSSAYNVWVIFVKATEVSPIRCKFKTMLVSLLHHATVPVTLNLVTDATSNTTAKDVIFHATNKTGKELKVNYYDINSFTKPMQSVIPTMKYHFTSNKGGYYSDSLFFISLCLHRVAPLSQSKIVLIDVDTSFQTDVSELFKEFDNFSNTSLIGIAPELSPVYYHILYTWRFRHKETLIGQPLSKGGFPGFNSGVLLLDLDKLRESHLYAKLLKRKHVESLTKKYSFKGHLGDQDFYTIVALEHSQLFHVLDCSWNRQLCMWWKDHGYQDLFSSFYKCDSPVRIYHGNCDTPIPDGSK